MVMEYLDGSDLDAWLQKHGPLPVEQAVDFVLQACEAIADAHSLGIVHRDLKPANLFCIERSDGGHSIKVLDFGISKVTSLGDSAQNMTRTATFLGSPFYMSPEQMKSSRDVDARSDIWSLGVILFELLTGNLPFNAETPTELIFKVASEPAPPVQILRPDIPTGLGRAIATCLARDLPQRFQTVGDLATALAEYGTPHGRVSADRVVGTLRKAVLRASEPLGTTDVTHAPRTAETPVARAPSTPSAISSAAPSSETVGAPGRTAAAWGNTGADATTAGKPGTGAGVGIAVALALTAAIGGVFFVRSSHPQDSTAHGAEAVVAPSAPAISAPVPAPAPSPAAPASAAPSTTATATAAVTSTPTPTAAPRPIPRSAATPPPPAAPAAKARAATPNCNPPYFVDSAGDRQYKPECI
jgi:serine/threonine-protein kinase